MENVKLWDWVVWNQRYKWKLLGILCHQTKFIFFLCMYKCTHLALIHGAKMI